MKWQKLSDRWVIPTPGARYQVKWNGRKWMAHINPWSGSVNDMHWRIIVGLFETSKDAKKACEEHYHAAQERLKSEGNLVQHQKRDESGQAAEAGGRNRPVRRRKVKKEKVLTAQG